jgi:glycosyltransferase involved in cell wall biosynthesis
MPPRVSVIIATHNGERYIGRTLDSVLAQTYDDWEAIVTDDASTDGTTALVAGYAERHPDRIKLVRLDENVGPALARNAGVEASSGGELLALLDHDDRWREDYLEHMLGVYDAAVAEGRRVGVVSCNPLIETEDGTGGRTFAEHYWWSDHVDYDAMIERDYVYAGALFPREGFERVGRLSGECWGSDDYDLWLRMMEDGYEVVTTRESVAVYRCHSTAISANDLTMADAAIAAYSRALRRGRVDRRMQRKIRRQLRHYRALRERALVRQAVRERRPFTAGVRALLAAPRGLIAFAQSPERWGEWARDLTRSRHAV